MADPESVAQRNEAYRALGRFFAEFSRLTFHMRFALRDVISLGDRQTSMLVELITGEMAASSLTNAFFGVCNQIGNFTEDEKKVSRRLQTRVEKHLPRRNDLAHGDWWIGWGPTDGPMDTPQVSRTRPGRRKGHPISEQEYTADELDEISDDLITLRTLLFEFARLAMQDRDSYKPGLRVGDVLVIQNGEVVRAGPRAKEAGDPMTA